MALRTTRRKLQLESLEARDLMAGDVTVRQSGHTLYITGDDFDNAVIISRNNGRVLVSGVPDVNDLDTTINGRAVDVNNVSSQSFSGVKSISTNMNGGDDTNLLTGLSLKSVTLKMDDKNDFGDDNVFVGGLLDNPPGTLDPLRIPAAVLAFVQSNVSITGKLDIVTGNGDDLVTQAALSVTGQEHVSTGDGDDQVFFGAFTDANNRTRGVSITGILKISTGDDNDEVSLVRTKALLMYVSLGDDADVLTVGNTSATAAFLEGGSGPDNYFSAGGNKFIYVKRTGF